jgi:hypothetical protein
MKDMLMCFDGGGGCHGHGSSFLPLVAPDGIDDMQANLDQQQRGSLHVISYVLCPFVSDLSSFSFPDNSEL